MQQAHERRATKVETARIQQFRLIATDLDGTLLRHDGSVSARSRAALERAQAAGIVVVLVSARPPRVLRRMARDAGVGGLAVCSNGALTYDLEREAVTRRTDMPADTVRRLILALRQAKPGVCFALERGLTFACEPEYAALRIGPREQGTEVGEALALCEEPAVKLLVRHATLPVEDLMRLTEELAGAEATVTHAGGPSVEVSPPGVDKAWALSALCAERGIIASEVVAFGDMPNDLPMLRWAGCGVAVANAHREVLAAAGLVTGSNDEDGVAAVVERLLRRSRL
jgi:Cof subfamily protein (haloacid dehalogenase superfamily)